MKKEALIASGTIILILGICFALAAVKTDLPPTRSVPFSTLPAEKPTATATLKNDKVVMRVNGEPVTEHEFNTFLQQAPEEAQSFYASLEGRRTLADQLVRLKAIEQEGRRLGVENDPDAASRIEIARANIIAAYALRKMVPLPSEQSLRSEFEKQKKEFETVQLSHILVAYAGSGIRPKSGSPLSAADAMKKALSIEDRLRNGADFAQMAKSESDDVNSAAVGGLLGDVSPAALPPAVQVVVASLKDHQISWPVKSQYGIHIFKSGSRKARPYEELRPVFTAKLQRDEAEATLTRLQKSAKVELDPKFFPQQKLPPARGRS